MTTSISSEQWIYRRKAKRPWVCKKGLSLCHISNSREAELQKVNTVKFVGGIPHIGSGPRTNFFLYVFDAF